jgi:LysM repeat protein
MKRNIILFGASLILANSNGMASEAQFNASDVLKYAVTSHGTQYLLRWSSRSLNAWFPGTKARVYRNSVKIKGIKGNTDCSGLVAASLRHNGYRKPQKTKTAAPRTYEFDKLAKSNKKGLHYFKVKNNRKYVKHGDALNRIVPNNIRKGHIILFNGHLKNGQLSTVEAKCFKCGVGRFSKSWNRTSRSAHYKILRSKLIHANVKNKFKVFSTAEGSIKKSTYKKSSSAVENSNNSIANNPTSKRFYTVKATDNGWKIAKTHGIKWSELQKANPNIDWRRMRPGLKIVLPGTASAASDTQGTESRVNKKIYRVKRGDSPYKIAKRFALSLKQLYRANPGLKNQKYLKVGQKLNIPN